MPSLLHDSNNLPLIPEKPIAIAVSGGADSVAALHALCHMRDTLRRPASVTVLHYHHGLRNASDAEYIFVQQLAEQINCAFIGEKAGDTIASASGNTQQLARTARYAFFERACRQAGITALITAHHQNDQAETILMRLLAGAGAEGLRGMREQRALSGGVTLLRPFLAIPRASLHSALPKNNTHTVYHEDKSNNDRIYSRTRIRNFLSAEDSATPRHIISSARALDIDADYIAQDVTHAMNTHITYSRGGYIIIKEKLLTLHPALLHRIFHKLHVYCGNASRPRAEKLHHTIDAARVTITTSNTRPRAFGGYLLRYVPEYKTFHLYRDSARCPVMTVSAGEPLPLWDSRFRLRTTHRHNGGTLLSLKTALTSEPGGIRLSDARKAAPYPFYATDALPVLRHLDNRLTLPHIFKAKKARAIACPDTVGVMACVATGSFAPDLARV